MMTYSQPMYVFTQGDDTGKIMMNFALMDSATSSPISNTVTPVLLDTGSCGLVVTASTFFKNGEYGFTVDQSGNITVSGTLLAGISHGNKLRTVTYTSSSDAMYGFDITIPFLAVGVSKQVGFDETTIIWPVVATKVKAFAAVGSIKNGVDQGKGSVDVHMCGIGFGRPDLGTNIFIGVNAADGTPLYPSFLLTKQGIWLGYQQNSTNGGVPVNSAIPNSVFNFQQLSDNNITDLSKVPTPIGSISVGNSSGDTKDCYILVDTGIDYMIANTSTTISSALQQSGTNVTITMNSQSYSFTTPTNGANGTPTKIKTDVDNSDKGFVNTGISFLQHFQYYFDFSGLAVGVAQYPSST